jgi:hypothetical protein
MRENLISRVLAAGPLVLLLGVFAPTAIALGILSDLRNHEKEWNFYTVAVLVAALLLHLVFFWMKILRKSF